MRDKIEKQITESLFAGETLITVGNDDILSVTRNTAGNMLPGFAQEMTVAEAISFGAWCTSQGTMECSVTLHPGHYEKPLPVHNNNGFIYAVEPAVDE